MQRRLIWISLVCLSLAGCDQEAASDVSHRHVRAVRASVVSYESAALSTGEVRPVTKTDLSFRAAGQVTHWEVDIGAHVKAGDILAKLDDTEQRADVEAARAGVHSAEAVVKQKMLAFKRFENLVASKAIPRATFDRAQEDLASARAALKAAETGLATAEDALSYMVLKADADGIITARRIEVGQVVALAQPAYTLARDGGRDAVFNVFKAFFLEGEPQADVRVALVDNPSVKTLARIREVSPTIDVGAGTVRVKVALPGEVQWPLGASVIGEFRPQTRTGIALPATAMSSADGDPAVWVINPATNVVTLKKVRVSQYRTADVLVASGLSPDELVVTEGNKFLRENQLVAWELK